MNTEKTSLENESQPSCLGAVSSSVDFWKDAEEFLKNQLPNDFEYKLKEYVTTKGYNKNEFMLFKNMLEQAVGFHGTMVMLKHYC